MSPSVRQSDLKTRTVRLTNNSIVISFRRCDTCYENSDQNKSLVVKRADISPDRHLSPAVTYTSEETSLNSASGPLQCTCGPYDGWTLFKQFLKENSTSIWNPYLISCLTQLEFLGFLHPLNLLIGGTEFCLEVIRSSWARRVLKAPKGFRIEFIGE